MHGLKVDTYYSSEYLLSGKMYPFQIIGVLTESVLRSPWDKALERFFRNSLNPARFLYF